MSHPGCRKEAALDIPVIPAAGACGRSPVDQLVVCRGDSCSPNTLIGDDGRCCGHVDLPALGGRSVGRPRGGDPLGGLELSGPGMGCGVLAAYSVEQDPARIDCYRRLWHAEDVPSR